MTDTPATTNKSPHKSSARAGMKLTPDELAVIAAAEVEQAQREARRQASTDARARAQAALDAELQAPLVPGGKPHSLERIAALRPRVASAADAPLNMAGHQQ